MALLPILEFPDPRLRTIASNVTEFDAALKKTVKDMFETMYEAPGIGLAASQINLHKKIIVIDISDDKDEPLVLINPEFEVIDQEIDTMQEGCLSVPGFYEDVTRPKHIKVTCFDENGTERSFEAKELLAVCIQHEIDHLNGKLFVDYISKLKRNRIKTKLEKLHKYQ